jgi:hypothetical protein
VVPAITGGVQGQRKTEGNHGDGGVKEAHAMERAVVARGVCNGDRALGKF